MRKMQERILQLESQVSQASPAASQSQDNNQKKQPDHTQNKVHEKKAPSMWNC